MWTAGRTTTATSSRPSVATGLPSAGNRGDAAGQGRHRRQPARRGALSHLRSRVGVGRHRLGIPRADAQRALSPVQRRSRRARWRMRTSAPSGCSAARPASDSRRHATSSIRSTWYDNGVKNPVSNVTIGTNLQQRQNLGRTRIRGWQNDVEFAPRIRRCGAGGYLFNNAKVTEFDGQPGARRVCISRRCRSTAASVSVCVHEPALPDRRRDRHVLRPPVRRRPEPRTKPGETEPGLPPYGVDGLQRSRVTSAATSRCSSACRTCSTRSTTSSSCRPRRDRRVWSTAAFVCASRVDSVDARMRTASRVTHRAGLAVAFVLVADERCAGSTDRRRRARRARRRLRRTLPAQLRVGRRGGALRADGSVASRLRAARACSSVAAEGRRRRRSFPTFCSCRCRAKAGCRFATSSSATANRCAIAKSGSPRSS